jgi:hypothetical protein
MRTVGTQLGRMACLLALILASAHAAAAQVAPPPSQQQQQQAPPAGEDESESETEDRDEVSRPRVTDPATILRRARLIYVRSDSVFVDPQEVEASLIKRKEVRAWGMTVTRNEHEADLIIEIRRKALTRRFTFVVLDPRTMHILTSAKMRSVLFGKKIPNKIAEKFANRVKVFRPYPPVATQNP